MLHDIDDDDDDDDDYDDQFIKAWLHSNQLPYRRAMRTWKEENEAGAEKSPELLSKTRLSMQCRS